MTLFQIGKKKEVSGRKKGGGEKRLEQVREILGEKRKEEFLSSFR